MNHNRVASIHAPSEAMGLSTKKSPSVHSRSPLSGAMALSRTVGNQAVGRMIQSGIIQKKPDPSPATSQLQGSSDSVDSGPLFAPVQPFMARALGSETIDGFETGKSDVSAENKEKLKSTARYILGLLHQYPGSTVRIIGHTDAIGTDEKNISLGQQRADSTAAVMIQFGVSADIIKKESKGESELLVKTGRAEPRNRRAEVRFEPLVPMFSLNVPGLTLTPPSLGTGILQPPSKPLILFPNQLPPTTPPFMEPIAPSPDKPKIKNWLEEGLKRDKLLRELPPWMRDKVVDALKDGDEKAAEKIIDLLPLDSKVKTALQALAKGILQTIKGKTFKMPPNPSWRQMPEEPDRRGGKPYTAPGEVIIPGPTIRF